jgi:hypothetical protein
VKGSNHTITASFDNTWQGSMAATSSVIVVDDESVREGSRNKPNKIGQVDDTVHSRQEDVDQHVHVVLHLAD